MDLIAKKECERDFSFWVSRNRAYLALQGASLLFLVVMLLNLRMELISFLSFNLGRTHMFILCNGIVAILVKGSVLAEGESHVGDEGEKMEVKNIEGIQKSDENVVGVEKKIVGIEDEEEIVSGYDLVDEIEQSDVQLVEEEVQIDLQIVEEEDGFEEFSVEELNKKCDEFIRRMRGVISNGNGLL